MSDSELPPCGIYLTGVDIGEIPAGRLVYFHNHGDPGPGLYLPESWQGNRARFGARGHLLPDPGWAAHLQPMAAEGFYRVEKAFHCCEKNCRLFEEDTFVQLGYDASGTCILFTPELVKGEIKLPGRGTRVEPERLSALRRLKMPETVEKHAPPPAKADPDRMLH